MAMNSRGMFFTLMVIVFLLIMMAILLLPSMYDVSNRTLRVENRVLSMDNFISDMQRDTERGLYIASYRALIALESRIINRGRFLQNTTSLFEEALMNGTLKGEVEPLMTGSTFPLWAEKIQAEARNINVDAKITIQNITLTQNDPWYITTIASLSFFINDTAGTAQWIRNETINTSIPIVGFEDPLYIIKSFGRLTNRINKTPFEGNFTFYNGSMWNVTNIILHAEQSLYATNQNAPSFLMRLEGNSSGSPYGIESMVNMTEAVNANLIDTTSSIIDYHYWNHNNNGNYLINHTPGWIRIDDGHRARYNVTHLSYEE